MLLCPGTRGLLGGLRPASLAKAASAAALVAIASLGCAPSTPPPVPVEPRARPVEPAPRPPLFDLHSGFWVNLHQRLYADACLAGFRASPAPFTKDPAWAFAVDYYRGAFPRKQPLAILEDEGLVALNRRASALEAAKDLGGSGLKPELVAALEAAAAVYRREQWAKDDELNRRWIGAIEPELARHGDALARELSSAYGAPWPKEPIRVDVSVAAGDVGAYTVLDPPHTTITSALPSYQGQAALEMVFHEASHALVEPLQAAIGRACEAAKKPEPPTLWHALLFYTTGEIVKRRLGGGYVTYGDANGLYERRSDWRAYRAIFERAWQPYLAGQAAREAAIRAVVDALPAEAPQ